jgi:two-component system sensor histidine kinase VanS
VVLTVENTGEELTPHLVATLGEPFQRAGERIRAHHAGVDGLAIVKSIAQAHDGTLTLAPRAGGGLCATLQLPAAPPPLANDENGNAARPRVSPFARLSSGCD